MNINRDQSSNLIAASPSTLITTVIDNKALHNKLIDIEAEINTLNCHIQSLYKSSSNLYNRFDLFPHLSYLLNIFFINYFIYKLYN